MPTSEVVSPLYNVYESGRETLEIGGSESRRDSVCVPRGTLSVYDLLIGFLVSTKSETEAVTRGKFLIAQGDRDLLALTLSSTSSQLEIGYARISLNASPCSEGPVSERCAHLWLSHIDHSFPLSRIFNFCVGLYYYGEVSFNGDFSLRWKCGYISMALLLYIVYVPRTLK